MQSFIPKCFFSYLISLLIAWYVVPFLKRLAHKIQFLDAPDGKVKVHSAPIPYLGGVAVFIGLLSGLAFTIPLDSRLSLLLVGTTLLLLLGLIDDLLVLKPYQKFGGQIIASFCFVKFGLYLKEHVFHNVLNVPLSFFWMLTIINALNLVDVMDGLSSTIALGAAASFFAIAYSLHHFVLCLLLAAFAGGVCGFLVYNWPPASIYLGDAGAHFIGGFLATIPFLFDWGTHTPFGCIAPVIILTIPLLEIGVLILVRTYKGIPFYKPSPDHFACYFLAAGYSKKMILAYVALYSMCLGVLAYLLTFNLIDLATTLVAYGILLVFWLIIVAFVRVHRVR